MIFIEPQLCKYKYDEWLMESQKIYSKKPGQENLIQHK